MIALFLFIIFWPLQLIFAVQDNPLSNSYIQKLTEYSWNHPQEKAYLHTNKSFYVPGDEIWFKAYLMLGPYQVPDTLTGVLYVELIDPEEKLLDRKILHMRRGLGWGDFQLPSNIRPGNYILKAYTRYMMNFDDEFHFRKAVNVVSPVAAAEAGSDAEGGSRLLSGDSPSLSSDFSGFTQDSTTPAQDPSTPAQGPSSLPQAPSSLSQDPSFADGSPLNDPVYLQFFPEGGDLVADLRNYLAFKATDGRGSGVAVKGFILDSMGTEVSSFETMKFGMGRFSFKPERGKKYHAQYEYQGRKYTALLPESMEEGYAMHVNQKEDAIYVWVRNNMGINMDNSFIIGQFRGFPFITIHAEPDQSYLYTVFNIKDIPTGIVQLTFFDALGVPRCERLIYSENEDDRLLLKVESDQDRYKPRQKVELNLHAEDVEGNYPLTNLSLSIVNDDIVPKASNAGHIISYFQLESDLKGYIEFPRYYFNPNHPDRLELLDVLLMTHGWRRFVWKELLEDQYPDMKHMVESGFNILGRTVNFNNRSRPAGGNVRMFIYEGQFYFNEIESDANGEFGFLGLDIYDSTHVVLQAWQEEEQDQARRKKGEIRKKKLGVQLEDMPYAPVEPDLWPPMPERKDKGYQGLQELDALIQTIDSAYDQRTIMLDEVTVEESRMRDDDPFNRPGKLYDQPTRRIVMDSFPVQDQSLLIFDVIRKHYPNVRVSGMPPDVQVTIRGMRSISADNQAMLLIDGQEVNSGFLYYFPTTEVAFIDILSAAGAAIYGSEAMNGAIAIYTREGPAPFEEEGKDWVLNFVHPGYYRAREFYTPDYGQPEEKHVKPDYRRTLYWNPSLTTDELGNIQFSFYTSDERARYRVDIEGMTYNGIPFVSEYFFSVE